MKRNLVLAGYALLLFMILACNTTQLYPVQSQTQVSPTVQSQSTDMSVQDNSSGGADSFTVDSTFDLATANQISPIDILQEVTYYAGGGGPDPDLCTRPQIFTQPMDQELMVLNGLAVCGLPSARTLTGSIVYPDGRVVVQSVQARSVGKTYLGELTFKPKIDDPVGQYRFILEGEDGRFEASASYRKPNGPRLFKIDNRHILLYGFAPEESVRLFYYKGTGGDKWAFGGWQNYQTDAEGQLVVSVSIGQGEDDFDNNNLGVYYWPYTIIAVGEKSGEVHLLHNGPLGGGFSLVSGEIYRPPGSCAGLLSRLRVGMQARVAFTDGSDMRIRVSPGFSQEIINMVPEGTSITILQGPKCVDDSTWWQIHVENGMEGWMVEDQNDVYLLEPME